MSGRRRSGTHIEAYVVVPRPSCCLCARLSCSTNSIKRFCAAASSMAHSSEKLRR
jgi:hypothetical protein